MRAYISQTHVYTVYAFTFNIKLLGNDRGKKKVKRKKRRRLKRNLKFFRHEMYFTVIKQLHLKNLELHMVFYDIQIDFNIERQCSAQVVKSQYLESNLEILLHSTLLSQ
jgi:hypothetical protein